MEFKQRWELAVVFRARTASSNGATIIAELLSHTFDKLSIQLWSQTMVDMDIDVANVTSSTEQLLLDRDARAVF